MATQKRKEKRQEARVRRRWLLCVPFVRTNHHSFPTASHRRTLHTHTRARGAWRCRSASFVRRRRRHWPDRGIGPAGRGWPDLSAAADSFRSFDRPRPIDRVGRLGHHDPTTASFSLLPCRLSFIRSIATTTAAHDVLCRLFGTTRDKPAPKGQTRGKNVQPGADRRGQRNDRRTRHDRFRWFVSTMTIDCFAVFAPFSLYLCLCWRVTRQELIIFILMINNGRAGDRPIRKEEMIQDGPGTTPDRSGGSDNDFYTFRGRRRQFFCHHDKIHTEELMMVMVGKKATTSVCFWSHTVFVPHDGRHHERRSFDLPLSFFDPRAASAKIVCVVFFSTGDIGIKDLYQFLFIYARNQRRHNAY
jgi:hypothetical protein